MAIPLILAGLLTKLAENGLNLIGNAVINKGKDYVEKELGVSLDDATTTEAGLIQLQQLQNDKEEFLLNAAIADKKIDLEYYKVDAESVADARAREIAVAQTDTSWLAKNIVPLLALIIILGGGFGIVFSPDTDVRIGLAAIIGAVTQYYFGTSKGNDRQATAIQNLAANQNTGASK